MTDEFINEQKWRLREAFNKKLMVALDYVDGMRRDFADDDEGKGMLQHNVDEVIKDLEAVI